MNWYRPTLIMSLTLIALVISLVLCAPGSAFAAEDTIFVLDTSGSMRRGGLFDRVKESLIRMVRETKAGDHILIITFDNIAREVVDKDIKADADKENICETIDNFRATGAWTRMYQAFEKTVEKAQDLKRKHPKNRLGIYLLTDGRNDPPPDASPNEFVSFLSCIVTHFRDFQLTDSFVYFLHYGGLSEEEERVIDEQTDVKPVPVSRDEEDPFPHIKLDFSGFDFGELDLSEGNITRAGALTTKTISRGAAGTELRFSIPPISAFGPQFKISPDRITCRRNGQKESISIVVPMGLHGGSYKVNISPSKNVTVDPREFPFSFSSSGNGGKDWGWPILFLIILIGLALLYFGYVRTKSIWVERQNSAEIKGAKIKGWYKTYLGEKEGKRYLPFELPNYHLAFGWWNRNIYLAKIGEKGNRINHSDSFPCQNPEGEEVSLKFHDKEPSERPPAEPAKKEKDFTEKASIVWPE